MDASLCTDDRATSNDVGFPIPDGHAFALCLTHDVDRPYKRFPQALFYALSERPLHHLQGIVSLDNPYWQFDDIMSLEAARGVRSAFYFLNEPHILRNGVGTLVSPRAWVEQLGRYDVYDSAIENVIWQLNDGGWEVGIHGSLTSATDRDRLAEEKATLESVLGEQILGGRQHRLRLDEPTTWEHHRDVGLSYDTTLGSSTTTGFAHGYEPIRPFDDQFVVYPLTIMEQTLPDPTNDLETAWEVCESLLLEAAENGAVMTVLWHPRYFNEAEFPGYRVLYERLLDRALELDAWVGPPGALYEYQAHSRTLPAD